MVEHMPRDQELIGLNPAVQTAFSHLFLSLHQFLLSVTLNRSLVLVQHYRWVFHEKMLSSPVQSSGSGKKI